MSIFRVIANEKQNMFWQSNCDDELKNWSITNKWKVKLHFNKNSMGEKKVGWEGQILTPFIKLQFIIKKNNTVYVHFQFFCLFFYKYIKQPHELIKN